MAKWIDAKLRGSKGLSETDLEADLDRALVLFGYIQVCVVGEGCVLCEGGLCAVCGGGGRCVCVWGGGCCV